MKAFAFTKSLPIDHPDALHAVELPLPTPEPHDIRVAVSAVSVNPVDAKVRKSALPEGGDASRSFERPFASLSSVALLVI